MGVIREEEEESLAEEGSSRLDPPEDESEGWSKSTSVHTLCLKLPVGSKATVKHWGN